MKMSWLVMVVAVPLVLGCRPQTDLNAKCTLTKSPRYADGGVIPDAGPVPVLESEIKDGLHKDFISLGATDCDDKVCVRDAYFPRGTDPSAPAEGYCSAPCVVTSPRCFSEDAADDEKPDKKLSCRSLLLDQATLAAICADNPTLCRDALGMTTSPYFCVRAAADAGP